MSTAKVVVENIKVKINSGSQDRAEGQERAETEPTLNSRAESTAEVDRSRPLPTTAGDTLKPTAVGDSLKRYGVLGLRIWSIDQYGVLGLQIRSIDQYGVLGLRIRSIDQYEVLRFWIRSIGCKRAFLDN
ncbi:hypothetical protein Tco_0703123 [Tanacetum coccineum]|uniref:Uncharacterized protein n=1 Tax=Tanacetum coccineum TaxID=301880 RepID=A0ABQ4XZ98_9ASTR